MQGELEHVLDIGIALTMEKDFNVLLELILKKVMELTNCDGGTLYLLNGNSLEFRVMCTHSLKIYQGSKECPCTLPPVPLTKRSVSALAILENTTINIEDAYHCENYDLSGPIHYDSITGYHTQSILVVPVRNRQGESIGVLQLINAQNEQGEIIPFEEKYIRIVESVTSQAAVAIENMRYLEDIRELFQSLVRVFSTAVDERTPYNASHTMHMAEYGEKFLDYLNFTSMLKRGITEFSPEHKREILMSIWLHDIGKLITPLEIMNKVARLRPEEEEQLMHRLECMRLKTRIQELEGKISGASAAGLYEELHAAEQLIKKVNTIGFLNDELLEQVKLLREKQFTEADGMVQNWLTEQEYEKLTIRKGTLTQEERAVMEAHVVITERLLSQISFPSELCHVKEWAASHHEFLNGRGYPEHKKGDEIPREVRIITILDIFDALVASDRPYKKAVPVEKALLILKEMAGKEGALDPELTELFVQSRCWE